MQHSQQHIGTMPATVRDTQRLTFGSQSDSLSVTCAASEIMPNMPGQKHPAGNILYRHARGRTINLPNGTATSVIPRQGGHGDHGGCPTTANSARARRRAEQLRTISDSAS